MFLGMGRGGKDVGIGNRRGARCKSPLARARGVREVIATCDSDGVAKADGSLMFPDVLRPDQNNTNSYLDCNRLRRGVGVEGFTGGGQGVAAMTFVRGRRRHTTGWHTTRRDQTLGFLPWERNSSAEQK